MAVTQLQTVVTLTITDSAFLPIGKTPPAPPKWIDRGLAGMRNLFLIKNLTCLPDGKSPPRVVCKGTRRASILRRAGVRASGLTNDKGIRRYPFPEQQVRLCHYPWSDPLCVLNYYLCRINPEVNDTSVKYGGCRKLHYQIIGNPDPIN
jgi:hypothetical protein